MDKKLDWSALNSVLEFLEVVEVDLVIHSLVQIKGFSEEHLKNNTAKS